MEKPSPPNLKMQFNEQATISTTNLLFFPLPVAVPIGNESPK